MKEIPLTQGKTALVDDLDYELLTQWKWYARLNWTKKIWYAVRSETVRRGPRGVRRQRPIQMHRFLMGVTDRKIKVDHKDGNGLNNTRENLRACSHYQNLSNMRRRISNKSGLMGVYLASHKTTNPWEAKIGHQNKRIHLGYFRTKQEAYSARIEAEEKYFGEYRRVQ